MEDAAGEFGLWDELLSFYQTRSEETQDHREQRLLLSRQAEILDKRVDRWEDAFDLVVQAYQMDPQDASLEAAVLAFGEAHQRWDLLLKLFEVMARERSERALVVHLYQLMSRLSEEKLGQAGRAFDYWRGPSRPSRATWDCGPTWRRWPNVLIGCHSWPMPTNGKQCGAPIPRTASRPG
jgi:hypothetical protein